MGGFFGAISRKNCKYDVFFGTDYHSHLGTKRGGLAFYDEEKGFQRQIHNIENTPFRTKFEGDLRKLDGIAGIGPKRKQELLKRFKSLTAIGEASVSELERLLPRDAAAAVYQHFHKDPMTCIGANSPLYILGMENHKPEK